MANVIRSLKRLVFYLIILFILTVGSITVFDQLFAKPVSLPMLFDQAVNIIIIVVFSLVAIFLIMRSKSLLTQQIGDQAATIVQYALFAITALFMTFAILNYLGVSPTALLAGAGIISLTAGLVVSTFVGSILSGALVFTTHQFKVGDTVIVNNIPGEVSEMTPFVMRIRTEVGQMSIPNSAIASGGVIITAVHKFEGMREGRLHYALGDRVVTSYMNEQGTIKELTPLHTVVKLDSGKEITYLNSSVFSGAVAIAKVTMPQSQTN